MAFPPSDDPLACGPATGGAAERAPDLQLGLIGDNILASSAPRLHVLAGRQFGQCVRYDRLIPPRLGKPFERILADCAATGFRGVNVTYPYKEHVTGLVTVEDDVLRRIGAVNTVIFGENGPVGHNTDYSGFIDAYRGVRGARAPGIVAVVGAGGVGRAVAFGLVALGAGEIRLSDRDPAKSEALAADLGQVAPRDMRIVIAASVEEAVRGAQGLVNGTPLGMVGYPGSAIPEALVADAEWVFDAVYTPVETSFIKAAMAAGVEILSGYELFIFQGVNAWKIFSGRDVDVARLRRELLTPDA